MAATMASSTPTTAERMCDPIGSCSMTESLRTKADSIRLSMNRYAWTWDLLVGVEGIRGSQLSRSRYGFAG
ncbi:hypothetical protein GCM10018954_030760 [Kutzneria kofuensis]